MQTLSKKRSQHCRQTVDGLRFSPAKLKAELSDYECELHVTDIVLTVHILTAFIVLFAFYNELFTLLGFCLLAFGGSSFIKNFMHRIRVAEKIRELSSNTKVG